LWLLGLVAAPQQGGQDDAQQDKFVPFTHGIWLGARSAMQLRLPVPLVSS